MGTLALELNDAEVLAARSMPDGRTQVLVRSPGYAVVDGGPLLTGRDAYRASRLKPRFRTTRFWEALDTSPLPKPLPPKLTHADLVHAHLSDVWNRTRRDVDRVALLVPGWYTDAQLGLLLGIARALELPVNDLVDSGLAGALELDAPESVHVDVHLHRTAAARLSRGVRVTREELRLETGTGLVPLVDAWVTLVARTFVHQTRFDPLHRAETEQRLYDALPLVLDELGSDEATLVSIEASGKDHRVELSRSAVVAAALPYYREIVALAASLMREDEPLPVALSHRAARLPGLAELVERDLAPRVSMLAEHAPAENVLKRLSSLPRRSPDASALTFVTSLPVDPRPVVVPPPVASWDRVALAPTHVLRDGVAHAIEPGPFVLGTALPEGARGLELPAETPGVSKRHALLERREGAVVVEDESRYGCWVNGERVDRQAVLAIGDRLRLGPSGPELLLIEVKP